jgi:hypothetical protein
MEETPEGVLRPIPYRDHQVEYHGKLFTVAHPDTVALYEGAMPQSFLIQCLRIAMSFYHLGTIPCARAVWDAFKKKNQKKQITPPAENQIEEDQATST